MTTWTTTPFSQLLVDTKDGEWGEDEQSGGLREALIVRGTDFANLDEPDVEFPRRWVKEHIVERKRLQPDDIILEPQAAHPHNQRAERRFSSYLSFCSTQISPCYAQVSVGTCA